MAKETLEVKSLNVSVGGKKVLNGISLSVNSGELHVIMGPNGSGKSTFARSLLGMPKYSVSGKILLSGEDLSKMKPYERARMGLFLAFQNPPEIESIKNANFVRQASLAMQGGNAVSCSTGRGKPINEREGALIFKQRFEDALERAGLGKEFYDRSVNYNFSGGEKKKNELAQLILMGPKFAILDEIDSGLDVDSARRTAKIITGLVRQGMGIILITHSPTILKFMCPDMVYLFGNGRIVLKGNRELITRLERKGFAMLSEMKK